MKLTIEQERQITAQYQHIKELATLKYDAEEKKRTKFNSTVQSDANGFFIHDSSCVCGYGYLHRIPGKADLEFFSDSSICCCFFADCESTFSILSAMEMENRSISRYTGYEGYGCK